MRAVVMGGTSGIGLAAAEALTDDGVEVIVTGRNSEKLSAVESRVALAEQLDGTAEDEVKAFFDRTGPFEHLVLALGSGAPAFGPIRELPTATVRGAFDGKLFPFLYAIRHAEVTGSITLISAASARGAMPETVALAAVNGAIERMVPPLAAELSPVRVNAVAPGVVDTPWWSFLPEEQKTAQFSAIAEGVPAKRVGSPEDIAGAVRYLTSASYVTGTILPVDGGLTVS